jgi:WD40 repeat protein
MRLASAGDDRTLWFWDVSSSGPGEGITMSGTDMSFGQDGKHLVTFTPQGMRVRGEVWESGSSATEPVQTFELTADVPISASAVHPGKSLVALADTNGKLSLWKNWNDKQSSQSFYVQDAHKYMPAVNALAFRPDGERLATGGDDGILRVWDMKGFTPLLVMSRHAAPIHQIEYSSDGTKIISAAEYGYARIWDGENGKELFILRGKESSISGATISRDGARAATGTVDGGIEIWDADTGKELMAMSGDGGAIKTLAFSPDGSRLATGSADGTVRVWDTATGEQLLTFSDQPSEVTRVEFSPDGSRLAAARADGFVRVYLLDPKELIALAKSRLTRTLSLDECRKFLHAEQCPQ